MTVHDTNVGAEHVFTDDYSTAADFEGELSPATLDDLFDVLADERRRTVLQYLGADGEKETDLSALVAELSGEVDGQMAVKTSLHHIHLPKLDSAGMIAYERDSGRVRYLGAPVAEQLLDVVTGGRQ